MNTYFKFFPYIFLVLAGLFLYDAISRINDGENPVLSLIFIAMLIFMFFLKRWQYRKINNPNKGK